MTALACGLVWAVLAGCGAGAAPPAAGPAIAEPEGPAQASGVVGAPAAVPAQVPTSSLSGTVRSDADKTPLGRARVTLVSPALDPPRAVITAADGTYTFHKLPAGAYTVSVTRSGYAPGHFAERRSAPPATVTLARGQMATGVDVSLLPAGVIVGRVLDEDDNPFAGASVDALVPRTAGGQTMLVSLASAHTDDRGEFRLVGLPAGQYYVSAFDPAFADVGDETGPLRYTPTYYPGVVLTGQATRVSVTPGVEPAAGIVFRLQIVRPARVAGTITSDRQLISGAVMMLPIHGAGLGSAASGLGSATSQDVLILPDGSFAFRNVPPGEYQIRARGELEPQGTSLFATFGVKVEGRDIEHVDMALRPGARLEGQLIVEAERARRPAAFPGVRVRAPFADGSSFGDSPTGDVRADGGYAIRGLMPGSHVITVEGLAAPWVVKHVTWRGQDISDIGVEAESQQVFADVRVTVTDVTTQIAGTVRGAGGAPVPDATVIVLPLARNYWTPTSRRFRLLRSDAAGRYQIRGLPPGEYRVVASLDLDDGEAYRRELLEALSTAGVPIRLGERASLDLDLPLAAGRNGSSR